MERNQDVVMEMIRLKNIDRRDVMKKIQDMVRGKIRFCKTVT